MLRLALRPCDSTRDKLELLRKRVIEKLHSARPKVDDDTRGKRHPVTAGGIPELTDGCRCLSAVYEHGVFAASARGRIVRLNAATGKTVWRVDTKAPLSGGVGVGENMVLVGSAKGAVLAYNLDGKPLWKSSVSSEVLSAPQAAQGFVVVRSGDSRIFGLDAKDEVENTTVVRPSSQPARHECLGRTCRAC